MKNSITENSNKKDYNIYYLIIFSVLLVTRPVFLVQFSKTTLGKLLFIIVIVIGANASPCIGMMMALLFIFFIESDYNVEGFDEDDIDRLTGEIGDRFDKNEQLRTKLIKIFEDNGVRSPAQFASLLFAFNAVKDGMPLDIENNLSVEDEEKRDSNNEKNKKDILGKLEKKARKELEQDSKEELQKFREYGDKYLNRGIFKLTGETVISDTEKLDEEEFNSWYDVKTEEMKVFANQIQVLQGQCGSKLSNYWPPEETSNIYKISCEECPDYNDPKKTAENCLWNPTAVCSEDAKQCTTAVGSDIIANVGSMTRDEYTEALDRFLTEAKAYKLSGSGGGFFSSDKSCNKQCQQRRRREKKEKKEEEKKEREEYIEEKKREKKEADAAKLAAKQTHKVMLTVKQEEGFSNRRQDLSAVYRSNWRKFRTYLDSIRPNFDGKVDRFLRKNRI